MSNRMFIEIAEVKRRSQSEPFQEIQIFDDFEAHHVYYEQEIPDDPAEVLKLVCVLSKSQNTELWNMLSDHLIDSSDDDGIDIEGDWIELNDPRISEVVQAYRKNDKKFLGLGHEQCEVGDKVSVPDPNPDGSDAWNNEFNGTVIKFHNIDGKEHALVKDQEDNCYDVELSRLKYTGEE